MAGNPRGTRERVDADGVCVRGGVWLALAAVAAVGVLLRF